MASHDIPLIGPIINRIIGTRNERFVKKYLAKVAQINALEPQVRAMTDAQIRAKIDDFRARADKGETEESLIPDVFSVAREAMDRAVGIRNVLNPARAFDASVLPPEARALHAQLKERAASIPPLVPQTYDGRKGGAIPPGAVMDEAGEYSGCAEIVPGWMRVEIPPGFYDTVRGVIPESRPPFRACPFDVQLIGAIVLAQGKIAEMKTGEGKTIVGPLATYLACVMRRKVHVVTVNDYLVQRDRDWTFPFFHALGLTVGAIHPMHSQGEDVKRLMYRCDVVYGTTAEFGFDYLRDNMKSSVEQQVQRRRDFAIVDEVDSILIDEARTPLIISGPAHQERPRYELADKIARHMVEKQAPWQAAEDQVEACKMKIKGLEGDVRTTSDRASVPRLSEELRQAKAELPRLEAQKRKHTQYYELLLDRKSCHLTHDGISEAQRLAGVGSFYVGGNIDLPHLLEQSLRAHAVYQRDRDYIVMPLPDQETGETVPTVVIVDVNTGRPMVGRQWSDGLHQAVEAKEQVPIKRETQTVASITIQNFFKMYKRLAGMTGTADTEAQEFSDIYKLDVVAIPTNRRVVRRDQPDLVLLRAKDKLSFIVEEIKQFHDVGRPVLVGTSNVEKSEALSQELTRHHQIRHEVLNAKPEKIAREAEIVEAAGQLGSVMIATNMAGRGTDIKLGRITRQQLLEHWLRRGIVSRDVTVESTEDALRASVYRKIAPGVLDLDKKEAEAMSPAELELALLRHWATRYTLISEGKIRAMDAQRLREALDQTGKLLLHRIHWFESIEEMGGLHVLGTERHESRRIDNQLRGRAGRQGDKGSSRFFISLEDDLMKNFGGETTQKFLAMFGLREGVPLENEFLSKQLEKAQRKVEERNFQWRKNILEYDEVMEHQRRRFYGTRQRVLEGRDLRGLIFEYIQGATSDAVASFLHPDYSAVCVSEYVHQKLGIVIPPARLRRMEPEDLVKRVRDEALADTRNLISVTLGEYWPERIERATLAGEVTDVEVEFDAQGLTRWAHDRFGVEFGKQDLATPDDATRAMVEKRLEEAADARINGTELAGVATLLEKSYPVEELRKWVSGKFDLEVSTEQIAKARAQGGADAVVALIVGMARDVYNKRELGYPVRFRMAMTQQMVRANPKGALDELVRWANLRYGLGWTPETLMKKLPPQVEGELMEAQKKFVEAGTLDKAIAQALACKTDDELDTWWQGRFAAELPQTLRRVPADERDDQIRSRVESQLRFEMVGFERAVMLQVLDTIWREHLYRMDQLKDSISYRSFSQQDPRIEYKREGSRMFNETLDNIRERVTDLILRVELMPQVGPPTGFGGGGPGSLPPGVAMPGGNGAARPANFGSSIAGPGLT
jgi:preprotein translocase subunit SecA